VRKNARFFLAASLAALALRLLFVFRFPGVVDDSRLYANIATNWLHGVYGISNSGQVVPTFSRLPGYPAFLAAIFAIFGSNNFRAVLLIQTLFDLGTCFVVADLARRMFSGACVEGGVPARRALSVPGQLCGSGSHRDAGNILYCVGAGFRGARICRASPRQQSPITRKPGVNNMARLRSFHRGMHPLATGRRNSVRRGCRLFISSFSGAHSGEAARRVWLRAPAASPASCGSDPDHRSLRAAGPMDAAQPAHHAPLPAARAPLCQRLR
jgi:hypothetical protein